jgi:tetratricopeptide (TPR) repeat protein
MQQLTSKQINRMKKAAQALDTNQPREALRILDKVNRGRTDDPDVWYLRSCAYGRLGDVQGVVRCSKRVLDIVPTHTGALSNLANAHMFMGRKEEALTNYRKALDASPNDPTALNNYGRALSMLDRRDEAVELFKSVLEMKPGYAPAHCSLAHALRESGSPGEAYAEYLVALQIDPNLILAHLGIAQLYSGLGGMPYAEDHYRTVLRMDRQCFPAHLGLSAVHRYRGHYDKALDVLKQAERIAPNEPNIAATRAEIHERLGEYDKAYEIVRTLRDQGQVVPAVAKVMASVCGKFGDCDEALDLIDAALATPAVDVIEKQGLRFTAGNVLDKLGRYDEAFSYYREGNEAVQVPFDRERHRRFIDDLIECFNPQAMTAFPRARTGSARPIFILGMPRSGTSLTEQILASHSLVYGAGELSYIKQLTLDIRGEVGPEEVNYTSRIRDIGQGQVDAMATQYLRQIAEINKDALHVTDKMPQNFLHIGLIALLFPEAPIIHCRRDPLDTCLSVYFQNFTYVHNYATDLGNVGFYYAEYERLMRHWQEDLGLPMLNIDYEEMVEDPETTSRRLVEFCGLEWEDRVLDFHASGRRVATASYDQVRQPIYKKSKQRWRQYEKHLDPLKQALAIGGVRHDG